MVFNTGDGLKTLDAVADRVGPTATIEPHFSEFLEPPDWSEEGQA